MSTNAQNFYFYMMLAANATLVFVTCLALLRFERRWWRIENIWNSAAELTKNECNSDDIRAQLQASQRLEQRIGELQRIVDVLETHAPTAPPAMERAVPIENAVRMARLGASVDDLTRNCGLNLGEAHLLSRLHSKAAITAVGGQRQ